MGGSKDYQNSPLLQMVRAQKQGKPVGMYSICAANRFVIEACMLEAAKREAPVLIESTSNQVNQYGGYTGMKPADFAAFARGIAAGIGFPAERIILGGDHLGPNAWQHEPAATAMAKANVMIGEYVAAGFVKIHLDASMRCADDPGNIHTPLLEETVAARAAELCRSAEEAFARGAHVAHAPLYVIGTEVPIPGGAQETEETVPVTKVADVERTIGISGDAFAGIKQQAAWERVIALVVQPGVEFGDSTVFGYQHAKAEALSSFIHRHGQLVFEAHSTDYQLREALQEMVRDHFAVLKVGPWLTFALREALFALEAMEAEWLAGRGDISLSRLRETVESVMLAHPADWQKHYHGDEHDQAFARKYSYSDRVRYYWSRPALNAAVAKLIANLTSRPAPLSLLSQFMPRQYRAVREGEISNLPLDLIRHKIREVAGIYSEATEPKP